MKDKIVLLFLASFLISISAVQAAPRLDEHLTEFDFLLLGLEVRPEPEVQVVPRNTATGINIAVSFAGSGAAPSGLLSLLPQGTEVAAELVGPGLANPIQLRGAPGGLLPVPPIEKRGVYLVRDIRLEKDGEVVLRAVPDSATVEVIDQVLITQVTTRALTIDEIRQKGILFGDDDFTGFNFTLAMELDSRPVNIDFPVIFDSNGIEVPIRETAGIGIQGGNLPGRFNYTWKPVLIRPKLPEYPEFEVEVPDIHIPGLIVIPGDVGFLNQFFSALLLVSNGTPEGSGLSVRDLAAHITLPAGEDATAGTSDDPLVVAETASGQAFVLPIRGLGSDGVAETGDDTDSFLPSEQGQAEFLVEGIKEGFHEIGFDITGMLDGLPIGPIEIEGVARGGVLVRNPVFQMTFSAPATVRKGETFTLFVTVTNISQSVANLVNVSINPAQVAGATLVAGEPSTQVVPSLEASDSKMVRFRFVSTQTGQVSASYLRLDEGQGSLVFHLGVGERGVPLSPDTIVLPRSVDSLPADVVDAATRVLGQAWSLATAPTGTVPEGVLRVTKQAVLDHALEFAEAGFRVELGEDLELALENLLSGWAGTEEPGFEQLLRETNAGAELFEAIGQTLSTSATGSIADYQRDLTRSLAGRSPHILIGVGDGFGSAPLDWHLSDAGGNMLFAETEGSDLLNAAFVPFAGSPDSGRGVAMATRLGSSLYEATFTANAAGTADIAVTLPRADGASGLHVFSGVTLQAGTAARIELDLLRSQSPLIMELDRDGDGLFEDTLDAAPEEILESPGPQVLAATVIGPETLSGADPWGRVLAILFDRAVRPAEAQVASNYEVEANTVRSAILQLSGRLVFLFLDQPAGDLVPRNVTLSGLYDTAGNPLSPAVTVRTITSRMSDPGALVGGRVLNADGTPVRNAQVTYFNHYARSPFELVEDTASSGNLVGIAQQITGADGRYSFDYVRKSVSGFVIQALDPATGGFQKLSSRVESDGERIVVDLVMLGRGGVTGIVYDLQNPPQPVPKAKVLVTSELDPAIYAVTETDADGRYITSDLVVGPVTVKAVKETSSGIAAGAIQRAGTFAHIDVSINLTAGRVSGEVFENNGIDPAEPLAGIDVYFMVLRPDTFVELVGASTTTGADGSYVFADVPAGLFKIIAIDPVRFRKTFTTGNLVVENGVAILEGVDVVFFTEEVGTLHGQVLTMSGTPIPNALVTVAGRIFVAETGEFTIVDLTPGAYTVKASRPDSAREVSTSVNVAAHETTDVSLVLPGGGQAVVSVFDPAGAAIPNQQVVMGPGCSGREGFTGETGEAAVFDDVPLPGATFKAIRGADLVQGSVSLRNDGDVQPLTLRFSGFGTVTGTIADGNGDPVLGADVVLGARRLDGGTCSFVQSSFARQVRTGLDGTFVFDDVPVGPVTVSATSPIFDVAASASAAILGDGDVRDFTLTLSEVIAGELGGTVTLPDGTTPAGRGVAVTVTAPSRPEVTVITDDEGLYSFAKVFPPGRYDLTANDPVTGNLSRQTIYLLEDQDLSVDLRLLGRASVEVTVLDGAGDPVDEAFVELKGATFPFDEAAGVLSSYDGGKIRFERISEGDFTVTAVNAMGIGGRANGTVIEQGALAEVTVSLTVTGTVRGTFTTHDGSEPIPNAEVRLRQGSTGRLLGSVTSSATAGELGTFEFDFVPAGTVLVTATNPLTGRIGEASGVIETEDEVVDIDVRELGQGKISGSVTSGGSGVASAKVELVSSTGLVSRLANLRAFTNTNVDGEFTFDGVPVGSFTLTAELTGSVLTGIATGAIEDDAQEITGIEIALEPSGTVVGTVVRADGTTPVPGASVRLATGRAYLRTDTSSVGGFRFERVPAGDFTLTAEEIAFGGDGGQAAGNLLEGEELTVNVTFNGLGTVDGTAFESDGVTTLVNGIVRLERPAPFARQETATVGPDGSFRFFNIPVGEYTLLLTVAGNPLRGSAAGSITADGETDVISIALAESGSVTGIVVRPDGTTPAPNAVVTVTTGGGFTFSMLTGADGAFTIEGIPLGDFRLRAEEPVSGGLAVAEHTIATNQEVIDAGTLVLDTTPIEVESIAPAPGATLVPPDQPIVVRLTDPIDTWQLAANFTVEVGGALFTVNREVSADLLEVTLSPPLGVFPSNTAIEVAVSGNLKDTAGRTLGADVVAGYETGGAIVTGTVWSQGSLVGAGIDVLLTAGAVSRSTVTDATGSFRIDNVPAGSVTVQASEPGTGRAASTFLTIEPAQGLATTTLDLKFAGNISGQVFSFDGTPAGEGLEVRILEGGDTVLFTTTATGGTYDALNIEVGDFTVDVTDPANGDRGRTTGTLVSAGQSLENVNVQMIGVGAVRVLVRDTNGDFVPGANVTLSFPAPFGGTGTTLTAPAPEPDGSFLFANVLAGSFSVTAEDLASGLSASGSGTSVPNTEVTVDLTLEPGGGITGAVVAPDGVTPIGGARVTLVQQSGNLTVAETVTEAGNFDFPNVAVSSSPYRIDVFVNDRLRARANDINVAENEQTSVTLTLVGLGTVTGQLVPPVGVTLSTYARVDLTSLNAVAGGVFYDIDVMGGNYEIADVPVGDFLLTARDTGGGNRLLGEASGYLSADGDTVVVDITLIDNAVTFGTRIQRKDANELTYDIRSDGALRDGKNALFNATETFGLKLDVAVDGGADTPFVGDNVGSEEDGGREIATSAELIDGIEVERKIFVPVGGYFARYLESFRNTTGADLPVSATVASNINNGYYGSPSVVTSSTGDAVADTSDRWLVTDDGNDEDPFLTVSNTVPLGWVLADGTGTAPADVLFEESVGSSDGRLTVRYDFTVPAGGRMVLMHFVSMELSREAAEAAALRLVGLPPEALAGLSGSEVAEVVNFAVPEGGLSLLNPLPPLDGRVSGSLFAQDETTLVGLATGAGTLSVNFQSDHILFRRVRTSNTSNGTFRFAGDPASSLVVPRVGFTIDTAKTYGTLSTTAGATRDFAGPALLSDSPEMETSASSESYTTTGAVKAFDRNTATYWQPSTSDGAPRLELSLPTGTSVGTVRVTPYSSANLTDVLVRFLNASDQTIDTRSEAFSSGNEILEIDLAPTVDGVHTITFDFTGAILRVGEIDVVGIPESDLGSALVDLTFTESSSIDVTTTSSGGVPSPSSLTFAIGTTNLLKQTDTEGRYFMAPVPSAASPVTVTATASDPVHNFLRATAQADLTAGAIAPLTITYPDASLVNGVVTDFAGNPVPNRYVYLYALSGPGVGLGGYSDQTDATGLYEFTGVPSGDYYVRISHNNNNVYAYFTITAPTPVTQNVQLPASGTVYVTVLYDTGPGGPTTPVANARVWVKDVTDSDFLYQGVTSATGERAVSYVAGPYTVRVIHPTVGTSVTEASDVIGADGEIDSLTLVIPAFGTVTGTVRLADDSAAGSASVEVSGAGVTPKTTTAGSTGVYTLDNVEAFKPFTVTAHHPAADRGHITAQAAGQIIGVGATSTVDHTLPATGTVEVTVSEEDATPIASVDVFILDSFSTEERAEGQTDAAGARTITVVPEGSFTVRAELGGELIGEETSAIATHGEVVNITITRPADATVEGTVVAADGETPIPDTSVELRSEDGTTLVDSTTTDGAGFYRFTGAVAPGETALVRALFSGDNSISAETTVSPTGAGETLTADLELDVTVVKGRLFESDGSTAVSGAAIELHRWGSFGYLTETTDEDGDFFFFNQAEGALELVAEDTSGLTAYVQAELLVGETALVVNILLPEYGTVEGTVTDAVGTPLSESEIELRNANLRTWRSVTPDPTGFFRFERVALGSFTLTYEDTSYVGTPIPGATTGRVVNAGETVTANVILPDVGTVSGELLDYDGTPATPGDEYTPLYLEGRQLESGEGIFTRESSTSIDGDYREENVPEGPITVNVFDLDDAAANTGTVVAGAETTIDVQLGTIPWVDLDYAVTGAENIDGDGAIWVDDGSGYGTTYSYVNAKYFAWLESGTTELSGRQVVLGPVRSAGLQHTRKVFAPAGGDWVRYLEIFENPNGFDVDLSLDLDGELNVDSTSSGDASLDATDRYFVDSRGLAVVFAGTTAGARAPDWGRDLADFFEVKWRNVTVPAGGRVIVLHFAVLTGDPVTATTRAEALMELTEPAAISDLTPEERSQIVNFEVQP